jgi:hypothetical protein
MYHFGYGSNLSIKCVHEELIPTAIQPRELFEPFDETVKNASMFPHTPIIIALGRKTLQFS